ncbi:MAG TPA: hypothetical protein VEM13_00610 [Gemmatimonadales bacterium]|nr:hypothetical protein [Gemmatimonadales bacterium]
MRWTKSSLVLLLPGLAVACSKSEAKKLEEVRACTAITMNTPGAANCLVLQYKWKKKDALAYAQRFQHEQDSIAQVKADSTWRADAGKHQKEVDQCAVDPSGEVVRCLIGFGWAEARAKATEDSLWRHDASRHRDQLLTCTHQRKMQAGACLQLYYKWSPERALAVDDSVRRAQLRR